MAGPPSGWGWLAAPAAERLTPSVRRTSVEGAERREEAGEVGDSGCEGKLLNPSLCERNYTKIGAAVLSCATDAKRDLTVTMQTALAHRRIKEGIGVCVWIAGRWVRTKKTLHKLWIWKHLQICIWKIRIANVLPCMQRGKGFKKKTRSK